MDPHLYSTLLEGVYMALILVGAFSVFLYRKAYHKMKKTRMILSLYLFLISVLFENVYFGIATLCRTHFVEVYSFLMSAPLWIFPKAFMLITLIYFIAMSLSKNEYQPKNELFKDKV